MSKTWSKTWSVERERRLRRARVAVDPEALQWLGAEVARSGVGGGIPRISARAVKLIEADIGRALGRDERREVEMGVVGALLAAAR